MVQVQAEYGGLAGPEAAHYRTAIEMALGKAAHGERSSRRSQHYACQGSHAEKFFSPFQRRLDFRTRIANALDSLSKRQAGLSPCRENSPLWRNRPQRAGDN